uniref:Uncharacterized protein n=1 Tax=Anguilla anguilla TaxID=7936 RepID=A0A0E9WZA7_ANGAN
MGTLSQIMLEHNIFAQALRSAFQPSFLFSTTPTTQEENWGHWSFKATLLHKELLLLCFEARTSSNPAVHCETLA